MPDNYCQIADIDKRCPDCHLLEPADYCWQGRWDCPLKPPRAMDHNLWKILNELRRRVETLEGLPPTPGV